MKNKIIKADMDDMLFENRERTFGAYTLRKKYPIRLFTALTLVSGFFLLSAFMPGLLSKEKTDVIVERPDVEINLKDLILPDRKEEKKITLPPPPKRKIKKIAYQIAKPVPEKELQEQETIVEIDSLAKAPVIGLVNEDGPTELNLDALIGEGDDVPNVTKVIEESLPGEGEFIFVSEEPEPVNMDDIRKKIGYPDLARDAGIEGSVVIRILVDKGGNYRKHKVIKTIHPILARACEKEVSSLKFTPAIQGGKPIPFWVNIPFSFQLIDD